MILESPFLEVQLAKGGKAQFDCGMHGSCGSTACDGRTTRGLASPAEFIVCDDRSLNLGAKMLNQTRREHDLKGAKNNT